MAAAQPSDVTFVIFFLFSKYQQAQVQVQVQGPLQSPMPKSKKGKGNLDSGLSLKSHANNQDRQI